MGMCKDGNCDECKKARAENDITRTLNPDRTACSSIEPPKDLRDWHNQFRRRNSMGRRLFTRGTIRNSDTGQPKGKAAIKAAKRERVKAMKAASVQG